jgi:hypothetical protein
MDLLYAVAFFSRHLANSLQSRLRPASSLSRAIVRLPRPPPPPNRGEERHRGSTFQHRLPRTAFYRWPAAPHRSYKAATHRGVRGPRYPSARARTVGPSEASYEVKIRRCVWFWSPKTLVTHRVCYAQKASFARRPGGDSDQADPLLYPRSISPRWALFLFVDG